MDQQSRKGYISQITNILRTAKEYEGVDFSEDKVRRLNLHVDTNTHVAVDAVRYEKLRKGLLKGEKWSEKFTEEYVDKSLKALLIRLWKEGNPQKTAEYFPSFADELDNYSEEQTVYLPLANIQMNIHELPIGNITLINMTDAQIEEENILKDLKTILGVVDITPESDQGFIIDLQGEEENKFNRREKNLKGVVNTTPENYQGLIHYCMNMIKNKTCAVYKIVAERDRAAQRALEETQRVLELLRYAIHAMGLGYYRITIGLDGDINKTTRNMLMISSDLKVSFSTDFLGPLSPLVIDDEARDKMEGIGIFKLAEILKQKTDENSFDEILLRGVHWFANAQTQLEKENDLLSLTTCLEVFLTSGGVDKIANTLAEGVAFILGTELQQRKDLKKRVIALYNKRSKISHGGNMLISEEEREELRKIVGDFLTCMIQMKDKFKTRKDLDEWIDNQKFK